MDIDALNSRLDGVKYYDKLVRTNAIAYIETIVVNQCIQDQFRPWSSVEDIITECCEKYAKKMGISVKEFILIDVGGVSVAPTTSVISAAKQAVGLIKDVASDEVTIYRLYKRGSLDTVWKGHVKNYGTTDDELIALLERNGIKSPVDEEAKKAREEMRRQTAALASA